MTRFRRRFGGDLDQFLIYMVFIEAEAARRLTSEPVRAPQGLNALSISDITGVPRESVRRKLRNLTESGLLAHGADGLHYLAVDGDDEVSADLERLFLAAGRAV